MENNSKKGLIVFWLSLAVLICAAVSLNDSLDQLEKK